MVALVLVLQLPQLGSMWRLGQARQVAVLLVLARARVGGCQRIRMQLVGRLGDWKERMPVGSSSCRRYCLLQ